MSEKDTIEQYIHKNNELIKDSSEQAIEEPSNAPAKRLKAERSVISFLRANPDYFIKNKEILQEINLPHIKQKNTVSLIEKQVDVLRIHNKKLKQQLNDLFSIAKANEESVQNLHTLMLAILDCNQLTELQQCLIKQLTSLFDINQVSLKIFTLEEEKEANHSDITYLNPHSEEGLVLLRLAHKREPLCGFFPELQPYTAAEQVGSTAILPLFVDKNLCHGLLILDSLNQQQFVAENGNLFLQQISEVVSHALIKYLT